MKPGRGRLRRPVASRLGGLGALSTLPSLGGLVLAPNLFRSLYRPRTCESGEKIVIKFLPRARIRKGPVKPRVLHKVACGVGCNAALLHKSSKGHCLLQIHILEVLKAGRGAPGHRGNSP